MGEVGAEERWILGLACAGYGGIILTLSWPRLAPSLASQDAPAWVQAVGSIAAILVSAVVVWWQVNRQAQDSRSAEAERIRDEHVRAIRRAESILRFGAGALESVRGRLCTKQHIDTGAPLKVLLNSVGLVGQAIRSIELNSMPTPQTLVNLISGRKQFEAGSAHIHEALDYEGNPSVQEAFVRRLHEALTELRMEADQLVRAAERASKVAP